MVGSEAVEPSESFEDFSVLKLALERLLRSLKKGIVPANAIGSGWMVAQTVRNLVGKSIQDL